MMKSPTSLIRIRYAVGVMLALSAIFAVVLSAVTFTQDRALAQDPPTVSISVADTDVDENDSTVFVTVTLSAAPGGTADVIIPLTVGADGDTAVVETAEDRNDYSFVPPAQIAFAPTAVTGTYEIRLTNDQVAESLETLTVSLGALPTGYAQGETTSVTLNIADDDNRDPSASAISITGTAKVGETLTADTSTATDPDNADDRTTDEVDDAVASTYTYQWQREVSGGDNEDIDGATSSTYTPDADDVGEGLTVLVTSVDQYGNGNGGVPFEFSAATATVDVAHNEAKPLIQIEIDSDGKLNQGDVLGFDTSGMSSTMINDEGNLISGFDAMGDPVEVMTDDETPVTVSLVSDVTYTWHRKASGDADSSPIMDTRDPPVPITVDTYVLINDDVAKEITVVASYVSKDAIDADPSADPPVAAADAVTTEIESEPAGYVESPNAPDGQPLISGVAQVGATLEVDKDETSITDGDIVASITYSWYHGDDDDYSDALKTNSKAYTLGPDDNGKTIKVRALVVDILGDMAYVSSEATSTIAGSPGEISRIEAAIRSVTASAGDTVTLSVDIYGLQDAKDNGLEATFTWKQTNGTSTIDLDEGSDREIDYPVPSSPGTYTVTASLGGGECQPDAGDRTDAEAREDDCNASITVQVRRPSAPVAEAEAPVNPPGEIQSLIPDEDGNQYEVFTPVEGGTFDGGEGYSISVPSGAVPNGEYIGIRMSDDGAVSNLGMTHQRYTLGGNSYGVHAVDASGAAISSYVLEDPASVCVPLPAAMRTNISQLALVAINSDGSLTILAAQVRLDTGTGNTMVCGNLSNLPASVAVGAQGAPGIIPTPEPTPEPVLPVTGGASPASSMALIAMLLGVGVVASGTFVALGRRRKMVRNK